MQICGECTTIIYTVTSKLLHKLIPPKSKDDKKPFIAVNIFNIWAACTQCIIAFIRVSGRPHTNFVHSRHTAYKIYLRASG